MGPPPSALPLAGGGGRAAPLAAPRGAPLTWAAGGGAVTLAALRSRALLHSVVAGARSEVKLGPGRRRWRGNWGCSGSTALGLRVPRARPRRHGINGRASTFGRSVCLVTPPARVPP